MNGPTPGTAPLGPGRTVGHYAVVSSLGRGGTGEVFLARDVRLDRKVALKVLSPEFVGDVEHLQRFQREARNLAGLTHPNIVTVFAVEELDGQHLLSMEYVDGQTLRELVRPAGMGVERFIEIAIALSDAVGAAHERGVTHRDLKPENVMLTDSGRVKVLDFGLAKLTRQGPGAVEESDALTRAGVLLGTFPYMSPEQAEGRSVDHRSDIFSLGVIFYELLTGERPFKGQTAAGILAAILRDAPLSISSCRPDVPPEVGRIVRMCLQKDPAYRFQSALDLRNQLRDLLLEIATGKADSQSARRSDVSHVSPFTLRRLTSLHTTAGVTSLLAAVFAVNWLETTVETALGIRFGVGRELGYDLARAMHWLERGLAFDRHDLSGPVAIYAGSIAYFFIPPFLVAATIAQLIRRRDIRPYRIFAFAVAVTYLVSFGFYVLFPVPERWAFPDAEAVLLSDLWSTRLIQAIRPVSGLDNCFPSFHVASSVVVAAIWFAFGLRFRVPVAFLSCSVILSTFLLGIHWIADIVAGLAVGVLSVSIAFRLEARIGRRSIHRRFADLTGIAVASGHHSNRPSPSRG